VTVTYETEHEREEEAVFQLDPELAVSAALAQAELLRLETDIALAQLKPIERDEALLRDLSPLGR
jgi:hypothetical protein